MATISCIQHDGTQHDVEVLNGDSVMQGAVNNAIDGMVGECGGGLACATCICQVAPEWVKRAGEPSEPELEMLAFSDNGDKPGSRLSCQLIVDDTLDGLMVSLPESQY